MRKTKGNEEILQYVYDYGLDKASELLSIPQEDIMKKIFDIVGVYYPQKFNYEEKPINKDVLKYCFDNYQHLYNRFVKNNNITKCSLTLEDVLHDAIIRISTKQIYEDNNNIEDFVIAYIYSYIKYWELRKLTYNKFITYADFIKEQEDAEKFDF